MSKVLVEILVPASGVAKDVFLPYELRLGEVIHLVREILADERTFLPTNATLLAFRETGEPVDLSLSPEEAGLKNGSKLMLI